MEYLYCGSLMELSPLTPSGTVEVIAQTLDALRYIHSQGIIHRDIKWDNIVIQTMMPMRIKIIDFGLATASKRKTGPVGAILYCAPEFMTSNVHTSALDIWGLGTVILEVGQLFPKNAAIHYLAEQDSPRVDLFCRVLGQVIESTSEPLQSILTRVLRPDPADRVSARHCLHLLGLNRRGLISNFEDLGCPM